MNKEQLINEKEELRSTFLWKNEWLQVEGLSQIKAGSIFYMREPDGDIVTDSKGNKIFVATGDSYLDGRWTVDCVPVAEGEIEL